jgi:drug/metabolite transporter (DMT)-like permease
LNNAAYLKSNNGLTPHLALFVVQLLFSAWPIFGKVALQYFPSTGVVAFRIAGGALLFQLLRRARNRRAVERRDYLRLAFYGVIIALNQLFFVKGLALSTAINAVLLAVTIPIFALLISVFLGLESMTWRKVAGLTTAAGGVVYLIDPTRADLAGHTLGNLLIIANSFIYALYLALSRDVAHRYGAANAVAWIFGWGALVTVPFGLYEMRGINFTDLPPYVWAVVGAIVLVTSAAYHINAWASVRVNPTTVAAYIYLQPLLAFAFAPLILGERLGPRTLVAALLIFLGVGLVTVRKRETQPAT